MRYGLFGMLLAAAALGVPLGTTVARTAIDFNNDWRYCPGEWPGAETADADDSAWLYVNVPHSTIAYTPECYFHEDLGVFWYRRTFTADPALKGKRLTLTFEGAMQEAKVWLNGEALGVHRGGYTEFAFDVTGKVRFDGANVLAVRLDTRPGATFAPGKSNPDFQYFGGLYRDVRLTATDPVHITDPILSETVAGGGVRLTAPVVSADHAVVRAATEVCNDDAKPASVTLRAELLDGDTVVASAEESRTLEPGTQTTFTPRLTVEKPRLWSPDTPELYTVRTTVLRDGQVTDSVDTVYGIRKVEWKRDGCYINDTRVELVGANLHSESYMRGNALDNDAIDAEIRRLREHGFNFIRMSHYPHDRAFYAACDRYGVAVIDCLAGWQFYSDTPAFRDNCVEQLRDQIRVNRNNPCIVAWEPSLNESGFTRPWAERMHRTVHEELPADGVARAYTGGWIFWDVFDLGVGTPQANVVGDAAKHAKRPVIVSEYGDWNFGGFNSTTRVTREASPYAGTAGGDAGMLVQCDNIQSSFAFNRSLPWYGATAYWDYADYAGFDRQKLTFCGVVDVARLPKFGAAFFRSQTDPDTDLSKYGLKSGPMVYIANTWGADSPRTVRVYTNCDTVELWLDDKLIERRDTPDATMWAPHGRTANPTDHPKPNQGALVSTEHLAHPPFTFDLSAYTPGQGTLRAVAFRDGQDTPAAEAIRRAPGKAEALALTAEDDRPLRLDGGSAKLVWVEARDASGTVVTASSAPVTFSVEGPGLVIGPKTVPLRGGQWAVWVRSRRGEGPIVLKAASEGLTPVTLTLPTQTVAGLPPVPPGGDADEHGFVHPKPPAAAANILLGKTASASSVNIGAYGREEPSYANDGAVGTKWCATRPYAADPLNRHWWQADLGTVFNVTSVNVRFEAPADWRVCVAVSDDPTFGNNALPADAVKRVDGHEMTVKLNQPGRYLRVWLRSNTPGRWPCLREVSAQGTAMELARLDYNAPVTATSCAPGVIPENGNDGNPALYWKPDPSDAAPAWSFDAGTLHLIRDAELAWSGEGPHRYAIDISADGETWTTACDRLSAPSGQMGRTTRETLRGEARYVRIRVPAATAEGFWVNITGYPLRQP